MGLSLVWTKNNILPSWIISCDLQPGHFCNDLGPHQIFAATWSSSNMVMLHTIESVILCWLRKTLQNGVKNELVRFYSNFSIPYFFQITPKIGKVSYICSNPPVLNGKLPFWEAVSRPPTWSRNLPFWGKHVKIFNFLVF